MFLRSRLDTHHLIFPGPQSARPGLASVCAPSFSTCTPLTNTCLTPTEYWCGLSNVARSATVAGSKTATSAAFSQAWLFQLNCLSPDCQCLDASFINVVADARTGWRFDRSLSTYRYWRIDDVLFPIAL